MYITNYTLDIPVKNFKFIFGSGFSNFISFGIYKFKTFPPNVLQKINDLRTEMKTDHFLNNVYYQGIKYHVWNIYFYRECHTQTKIIMDALRKRLQTICT